MPQISGLPTAATALGAQDIVAGSQAGVATGYEVLELSGFSVTTVAALRAMPVTRSKDGTLIAPGVRVKLQGYFAIGDGGAGPELRFETANAPYADDGMTTFCPTGRTDCAWVREGRIRWHLRWAGAHADANPSTGAGTDDVAIFNALALYLHTNFGGGCIYLGNANYLAQSATCMLYDNIMVEGDGDGSCWVLSPTAVIMRTFDGVYQEAPMFMNADVVNGNKHVRLRNFKIDASAYSAANPPIATGMQAGSGIGCWCSTAGGNRDWAIEYIHTYQTPLQAIYLTYCSHIKISHCFVEQTMWPHADGMSAHEGDNVIFDHNVIYSSIDDSIAFENVTLGVAVGNLIDRNNAQVTVSSVAYYAHAINVIQSSGYTCSDIAVVGNTIVNCRYTGSNTAPAISVSAANNTCSRIVISGNTLSHATLAVYVGGANCSDVTVSDNIVTDVDSYGIYVAGATSGILVDGNHIRDAALTQVVGAITVDNTGSNPPIATVSNNSVEFYVVNSGHGILLSSAADGCVVVGNSVRNVQRGIYILGTNYCTVTGNSARDCTLYGILFNNASYCSFSGNLARNTGVPAGTGFGLSGTYTPYSFSCGANLAVGFVILDQVSPQNGTTANRPLAVQVGYNYLDTTLGKPIWLKATTPTWVDATGATV